MRGIDLIYNLDKFRNTIGKAYLHCSTSHDEVETSTLCFEIGGSDTIPEDILARYNAEVLQAGIFRVDHDLDIIIILLDLLEYTDTNHILALFASQPIRRPVIHKSLLSEEDLIRTYAYILYGDEVDQVAKAKNIEVDEISYNVRKLIEMMGSIQGD